MAVTEKQITDLDGLFKKTKLPASFQLDEGTKISDVPAFIESHLNVLKHNPDKPIYEIFYTRLLVLKGLISGKNV